MFNWLYNIFGNKQNANSLNQKRQENERLRRLYHGLKEQYKKYEQSEMCNQIQSKSKRDMASDNITQRNNQVKSRDSFSDMLPLINTPSSDDSYSFSCHDSYSNGSCDSGGSD